MTLLLSFFLQAAISLLLDPSGNVRVAGYSPASSADYSKVLAVYVEPHQPEAPALLGDYALDHGELVFHPRFPLVPGMRYRAVFQAPGSTAVEKVLEIPAPSRKPQTFVEQVYPTSSELPENALKFYIHFSAPMSRGDVYRHIKLLDPAGKPVDLPFLELTEELWDQSSTRFTLFFSPGRIKRGLVPNQEMGPPLIAGQRYTLVIGTTWLDGTGQPLVREFRREFTVTPSERRPILLQTWRVQAPSSGSTQPLAVSFPRPLDHALLERMIEVLDSAGRPIDGTISIDNHEQRWQFTPRNAWNAGRYKLRVDTALEDLAGNKVDRPFDVDVFEKVDRSVRTETKTLPFTVK